MEKDRAFTGRVGEITSFPEVLRGLLNLWAPGDLELDYGALYALPADERQPRRDLLDVAGYWSTR